MARSRFPKITGAIYRTLKRNVESVEACTGSRGAQRTSRTKCTQRLHKIVTNVRLGINLRNLFCRVHLSDVFKLLNRVQLAPYHVKSYSKPVGTSNATEKGVFSFNFEPYPHCVANEKTPRRMYSSVQLRIHGRPLALVLRTLEHSHCMTTRLTDGTLTQTLTLDQDSFCLLAQVTSPDVGVFSLPLLPTPRQLRVDLHEANCFRHLNPQQLYLDCRTTNARVAVGIESTADATR